MLTSHCTSLDLSLALREAGYPQENALFYWVDDGTSELHDWTVVRESWTQKDKIAAPLASELMEKMPLTSLEARSKGKYYSFYRPNFHRQEGIDSTAANALARLFLHLRQEQLI